ncbi:MAG: NADH:ubiquinone oxidoreductase [Chloroflexi bacterium]|nr:NADH:ubiquinone oxidoreductase [Chloroflexota bacterium]
MSTRHTSLYWLQCGGCGGDTMSLLGIESPDLAEMLDLLDVELLWHPSLSNGSPGEHRALVERLLSGEQQLDVLCVEGAIIRGPGGTGMYDTMFGRPKKDLVAGLARRAGVVVAVGTCAAFGGISGDGEVEATGAQFTKREEGGFLGKAFRARSGLSVINLPGCPVQGEVVAGTLAAAINGAPLPLNRYHMPLEWYGMLVHQGCTRNEYHEYRVEEHDFGEKGCMFFFLGCYGPLAYGPCNKILWNRRSSKTRVGVPCFGCTRPDFPMPEPFFKTRNIEGVPLVVPEGVDRAHYLAYKGMAAAAAPQRLRNRENRV